MTSAMTMSSSISYAPWRGLATCWSAIRPRAILKMSCGRSIGPPRTRSIAWRSRVRGRPLGGGGDGQSHVAADNYGVLEDLFRSISHILVHSLRMAEMPADLVTARKFNGDRPAGVVGLAGADILGNWPVGRAGTRPRHIGPATFGKFGSWSRGAACKAQNGLNINSRPGHQIGVPRQNLPACCGSTISRRPWS